MSINWFTLATTAAVLVVGILIGVFLGTRLDTRQPGQTMIPTIPTESPTSKRETSNFAVPFSYAFPDDDVTLYRETSNLFEVVSGQPPSDASLYPATRGGLIVASTAGAVGDTCPGRTIDFYSIPSAADVPALLREAGRLEFVPSNRSIQIADLTAVEGQFVAGCHDHLHFDGGLAGPPMQLVLPHSKVFLLELRETTLLLQIWSHSADGLEAWLPRGLAILDSIEFAADVAPPAGRRSSRQLRMNFERWASSGGHTSN